jgi:hypothetical protein
MADHSTSALPPRGPVRPAGEPRVVPKRPDPRPLRLALGITSLAAATAMTTAIVRPTASIDVNASSAPSPEASRSVQIRHVTQYVQLKPGETAPPGATVVQKPDPSPRTVIVTVPAPAPHRVVVVTRQSGGK